jgi:hypothetical protein
MAGMKKNKKWYYKNVSTENFISEINFLEKY